MNFEDGIDYENIRIEREWVGAAIPVSRSGKDKRATPQRRVRIAALRKMDL